ncbi:hypothetical protein BJP27_24090 (plasmid) [Pseudomonas oryzihabitans]|nr:hypothetical protein BJP27_24090 [Pseudomonas psychrotolerans]
MATKKENVIDLTSSSVDTAGDAQVVQAEAPDTVQVVQEVVPAAVASLALGKGQDPQAQFEAFGSGRTYPLSVRVGNDLPRPLVLSQAQPIRVVEPQDSLTHEISTPAELYDVIFGMIAVADRLDAETIGTITEA